MKRIIFVLALLIPGSAWAQLPAQLGMAPDFEQRFTDQNGLPISNGKLCSYAAGTTIPLATYSDYLGNNANQNPILLDAGGRPQTGAIYLAGRSYKFELRRAGTDTSPTCPAGPGAGAQVFSQDNVYNLEQLLNVSLCAVWDGAPDIADRGKCPMVYAEWWGATGNGTSDDTMAMQSAIATGKTVMGIPGKTYRINSGLSFSNPQQIIDLQNATVKPMGAFNAFTITVSETYFKNIKVDAAGLTGKVFTNTGTMVQQIDMDNIQIRSSGAANAAMDFTDIYLSRFSNIDITGHAGMAFHISSTLPGVVTNSIWITHSNFSGGTGNTSSLVIECAAGIFVDQVSFQNNASGANASDIRIYGSANGGVSGVTISHSYFEVGQNILGNNIYIGDPVTGSAGIGGIHIEGNYFQSSKKFIRTGTAVIGLVLAKDNRFVPLTGAPSPFIDSTVRVAGSLPVDNSAQNLLDYTLGRGLITIDGPISAPTSDTTHRNPVLSLGGNVATNASGLQSIVFNSTGSSTVDEQVSTTPDGNSGFGSMYGTNVAHPLAWCYSSDPACFAVYKKTLDTPLASGNRILNVDTASNSLAVVGGLMIGGLTAAPSITTAAGAPSGTCVTGSLYLRTDGGMNSTLYVCEAAVWDNK